MRGLCCFALATSLLGACGQKGPLVLPDAHKPRPAASATHADPPPAPQPAPPADDDKR